MVHQCHNTEAERNIIVGVEITEEAGMSLFTSACATLSRRLLGGGCSQLLETVQTFVRHKMKLLVDEAVDHLRKKAVSYVAATALAVVAAGSLTAAIAEGLIALGMPSWVSHLVLTAAAGVASWVCFARAKSRRVLGQEDSDRDEESEDSRREFTIRIVNEVRTPKPRRKKHRARARKVRRTKPKHKRPVRVRVKAA
jgi:hypothetical protein